MEIATRNVIFPGSVGLAQAHPPTKPLAMGDGRPPDLVQLRSTLPIRALVFGHHSAAPTLHLHLLLLRCLVWLLVTVDAAATATTSSAKLFYSFP